MSRLRRRTNRVGTRFNMARRSTPWYSDDSQSSPPPEIATPGHAGVVLRYCLSEPSCGAKEPAVLRIIFECQIHKVARLMWRLRMHHWHSFIASSRLLSKSTGTGSVDTGENILFCYP